MRIGYACINTALGTRTRTCRLPNATPDRCGELARANLADVQQVARWNAKHGIGLFRLSSGLVPFGSLPQSGEWRDELREDLRETGRILRASEQRVSTHPGQYVVLNSPRAEIVASSTLELAYQADMLETMGMAGDMVIHLGGAHGDKEAAIARFADAYGRLPENVLERLVLENDAVTWNAQDALRASAETGAPVVFDVLHHQILPSRDLPWREALSQALDTWPHGRTPKIHYSDQAPAKAPGAHADTVDVAAFLRFVEDTHALGDFDVMVEAKTKEQAVLPLLAALGLAPAQQS